MVPNGWEHKAFGEVVKLSKSKYDPKKSTDCFPCIELEHIAQGTGQLTGNVPASNLGSTKNKFKAGDVIFGKLRPYLRKYAQPNFDGVCSSEIWVFSPTKKIINPYLFQLVQTNQFISEANKSAGSKMPRADWGVVSEMVFPLPPLPEQRKIAKILSTWDKAISTTERLIDNSKQQKKALMQQLLTGKKRLLDDSAKPFEGEWELKNLNDIFPVIDSLHKTPLFSDIGYAMVRVADIKGGKLDLKNTLKVDSDVFNEYTKKYKPKYSDIVFSRVGSYGNSSIVKTNEPFCLGQNTVIASSNEDYSSDYVYQFLNSEFIKKQIEKTVDGSSHKTVSLKIIRNLKLLIPSKAEQTKIASVLRNADSDLEVLKKQLAGLKQEKKALMQQLLTGKRRVIVDSEAAAL